MTTFQMNDSDLREIDHSETLLINEAQGQLRSDNKRVYRFGFGQSPFSPPQFAIDALRNNAFQHDYLPVAGLSECREAVASAHQSYRNDPITANDIVIAPGSKMIIYAVMACYKDATVLLPQPSWVSYAPQASLLNHHVKLIPTNFESQWKINGKSLDDACKNAPKKTPLILVLNYPGNPTGMTYSSEELEEIAAVARKNNILIISDEIYGWLNHTNNHVSIAKFYPEGTFITTGLSKWCGAGGWRFGIGIFPLNISQEFKTTYYGIASETYSTTAAPVQFAATDVYTNHEKLQVFINNEQKILTAISSRIVALLKSSNVRIHSSDGGFYIFPDFSNFKPQLEAKGIQTSEQFCVELLNEKGVAMLPASAFGFPDSEIYTRLCYVDFDGQRALESVENDPTILNNDNFADTYAPMVVEGVKAICDYLNKL